MIGFAISAVILASPKEARADADSIACFVFDVRDESLHQLVSGESYDLGYSLPIACITYRERFFQGYYDAGGDPELEEHVERVVQCESGWFSYAVNPNGYYGLGQFSEATWMTVARMTGYWDWFDIYMMGYNFAVLMKIASPVSQWSCW